FVAGKGHKRIFALRHPKSKTSGLIISEDYGSTWKKINKEIKGAPNSLEFNYLTLVSDHKKAILFASMFPIKKGEKIYGGIYRSDDHGKTWIEKNNGLENAIGTERTERFIKIASTPADANTLFCVVDNTVFKSTDQGQSWRQILYPTGRWHNHIPDFDGKYAEYLLQTGEGNWDWSIRGIVGDFHSIVMAPSSADYVIITGKFGGAMTTNGGKTWVDLGFEYGEKSSVYDVAMTKFGSMTRPSTFTHKRMARSNFQVIVPNDVAVGPFSNNIAIAYDDEGLQIARDGGNWWEWSYWGVLFREATDARVVVYDPDVKDRLFLGTMGKVDLEKLGQKEIWKLYQSDDGGVTFKSIGLDFMPSHKLIKDNSKQYHRKKEKKITLGVKDILIDPTTPPDRRTMYVAYSTGVYKSADSGKAWREQIQFGLDNIKDFSNDNYYLKFAMNPKNNLEIYLATYEGLYKTSDGGELWRKVSPEIFGTIKSLALAKSDPAVIYVVATKGEGKLHQSFDSHLWKSTDGGKTWKEIDEQQTQFITVHPKDKNIVYRALYSRDIRQEDTGLFRSKNGGETWEKINRHLPMSFKGGFKHKGQIVFDPKN
ncbi:MAG: VPS10 domain-containing protein, partial [Nitrososphaera sp.]